MAVFGDLVKRQRRRKRVKTHRARAWACGFLCAVFLSVGPKPLEAAPTGGLSAGEYHTCALTSGGGVVCWGQNFRGALGDGTMTNRSVPVTVRGLAGVTAVAAGGDHTCALTSEGAVRCWGWNGWGQLGDGTLTQRSTPVAVSGLANGVIALAAGNTHNCAVTRGGGAVCWGDNSLGQLGDGTTTQRSTPVAVSGLANGVIALAAGREHTCAVTSGGGVVCWGQNFNGSLGDGTTTHRSIPVAVNGLSTGVIAVAAGRDHSCVLTNQHGVRCWGDNFYGQLGDGTTTRPEAPVAVSGLANGVIALEAGRDHNCATTAGGRLVCWGRNGDGQVGDGTTTDRTTPVAVVGLASDVTAVSAGGWLSCALTSEGGVRCWGLNRFGELGDGTTTRRLTPVVTVISTLLSPSTLLFAAIISGSAFTSQTAAQTVRLLQTEGAPFTWTATSRTPWLTVTPVSGSGSTPLSVGVRFDASVSAAGNATGTVDVSVTGASTNVVPITVTLRVVSSTAAVSPPFGVFETPAGDATVLAGSIAVTGWTLDNIGVQRVELWRDLQAGETTPPFTSTPSDPRSGKVFIANATFVDGARPDVEAQNPTIPSNYRAGWGYPLLTWGLANQGNGTYTLYAFAFDEENNVATIGSKTIVVNNNAATKPFGSIDTPAIGGDAAGPNFGWGLTPKVNGVATCKVPSNGVQVSIDSGPLQPVSYGDARTDIAAAFPGFSNTGAAGGHFIFDWSTLAPGAHTIGWLITDDCGRADGVGSRFFNVASGSSQTAAPVTGAAVVATETESDAPITVARSYGELPEILDPRITGSRIVEIEQGGRIELRTPRGYETAYQIANGEKRAPPLGSTWDTDSGIFYWQPAPGFLGTYRLVFSNGRERISVRVVVLPR
jgi:alpha-tubulin suppressor-like RCC1 family protein